MRESRGTGRDLQKEWEHIWWPERGRPFGEATAKPILLGTGHSALLKLLVPAWHYVAWLAWSEELPNWTVCFMDFDNSFFFFLSFCLF